MNELKWWRDLTTEQKRQLMQENKITVMTYHEIERLYKLLKSC
jgi:hypothetical protein